MQQRIVTIEQIQHEIQEYGISRMARQLGCTRRHLQRIVHGQRQPGKKLLNALQYEPLITYRDIMSPKPK